MNSDDGCDHWPRDHGVWLATRGWCLAAAAPTTLDYLQGHPNAVCTDVSPWKTALRIPTLPVIHYRGHLPPSLGSGLIYLFWNRTRSTPWGRKKETLLFCEWIFFIRNVTWQNLVLVLLQNIVIDVTYLISEIYTRIFVGYCAKVWRRILRH